jgi:hypothetical protein
LLCRLYRAISRRDYDQLRALKPVLGVARPLWRSKELPTRQSLHDLPPGRLLLADHDQILPLNQGHLMAQGSHFWDFGLYCRPAGGWGPPDHIR